MVEPVFEHRHRASHPESEDLQAPGVRLGRPGRRREILAGAIALVVILAFFWRPLFLDLQFYHSDTHALSYPVKELMAREFRAGRLPLWDPYSLCGYPIHGSYIFGTLLPHNLLFLLLPFPFAFRLFVVIKHLLAGLFQFMLLRRLNISSVASVGGAVAFALSGPLLSLSSFHDFSFECLPLMVWLWMRFLETGKQEPSGRGRGWWLALFGCAFVFLHGDLQTFYTGFLLVFFLPLALFPFEARHFVRSTVKLALLVVLVALLTAAQLLPAVAAFYASDRGELGAEERNTHSVSPRALAELIVPRGLGQAAFSPDFVAAKYIGCVTFALALMGVFLSLRRASPWRRRSLFFLIAALLALLFSLGRHFPLLDIFTSALPGLGMFRYPQKWLGLFAFALSTLAAIGISRLPNRPRLAAGAIALLMVSDIYLSLTPFLSNRLVDGWAYDPQRLLRPQEQVEGFSSSQRLLRLPTDGIMGGLKLDNLTSDNIADREVRSQLIGWNQQTLLGNTAARVGVRRISGITSFRYGSVERLWREAAKRGRIARAVDIFSGGWILSAEEDLEAFRHRPELLEVIPEGSGTSWETGGGRLVLLRRPSALPRALVVAQVIAVPDEETALEKLLSSDFDPIHVALIEAGADVEPGQWTGRGPSAPEQNRASAPTVRFVKDDTASLLLTVDGVTPPGGLLILNDTYDEGWKARVNGEERTVWRTNVFARGVRVPSGRSEVEFVYRPASLTWGLACSLCAVGLSLVLMLVGRRRSIWSFR